MDSPVFLLGGRKGSGPMVMGTAGSEPERLLHGNRKWRDNDGGLIAGGGRRERESGGEVGRKGEREK
ncbi:hypothetical protein, partial [Pseudomonas sp. GZD-209]|uniref:hypothetical protein n=1 Tax=Pseudomonas sp. GZD-209 TaxID=3404807 RepID=UPI003BB52293